MATRILRYSHKLEQWVEVVVHPTGRSCYTESERCIFIPLTHHYCPRAPQQDHWTGLLCSQRKVIFVGKLPEGEKHE